MSIYALRHNDLIKIGYSSKLVNRITQLIAMIPGKVDFLGHMPGDRDLEIHLHQRFSDYRFQGEWFVSNDDIEQFCRIALTPDLPEPPRVVPKSLRAASDDEWLQLSVRVRKAAALRWPEANHTERKSALSELLGWNLRRVRSLYEAQHSCRLKNHEMVSLTEKLFSALIPATPNTIGD